MKLFHGSSIGVRPGKVFTIVPGANNAYGVGVYLTPYISVAKDYGEHVYSLKIPSGTKINDEIYLFRGGIQVRVTKVKKFSSYTLHVCKVLRLIPLEEASKIAEKKSLHLWKPAKALKSYLRYHQVDEVSWIKELEWEEPVSWPDPTVPGLVDRALGKTLGLTLSIIGRVNKDLLYLKWLGHYLLGSGKAIKLDSDTAQKIVSESRRNMINDRRIVYRADPDSLWFKVLGTFRGKYNSSGELKIYDIYEFGRQPGQKFNTWDIYMGGRYPLIWATSAFAVGPIVAHVYDVLSKLFKSVRKHSRRRENVIIVSNGFWKQLGGKAFMTYGFVKKRR